MNPIATIPDRDDKDSRKINALVELVKVFEARLNQYALAIENLRREIGGAGGGGDSDPRWS